MERMSVEDVKLYAKEVLSGFEDWAHSFTHVKAILNLLDDFFANVGVVANREVLYIASILHDVGRTIEGNHTNNSVRITENLSLNNRDLIKKVILEHDYSKAKAHEIETVEGKILWDVDNLESNGYIGLIRIQEHAKFLKKDLRWGLWEFAMVWHARPEHMHFDYTARLMERKKVEEERYLPILFEKAGLSKEEIREIRDYLQKKLF